MRWECKPYRLAGIFATQANKVGESEIPLFSLKLPIDVCNNEDKIGQNFFHFLVDLSLYTLYPRSGLMPLRRCSCLWE